MLNLLTSRFDLTGVTAIGRAARERLYRERIMFVHVPKSGGTSLSHSLRVRYPFSHFRLREEESWQAAGEQGTAAWMDFKRRLVAYNAELGLHFIQGHIAVDAPFIERYGARYHFVTILRDPVARAVSHYIFEKRLRQMSPEAFLESDRGCQETQVLCHFFGELPWDKKDPTDATVERAIENLEKFAVVGVLEDLEPFYNRFARVTGKRLSIPKRNVGNKMRDLPEGFLEQLRERCAADQKIYRHFSQIAEGHAEDGYRISRSLRTWAANRPQSSESR